MRDLWIPSVLFVAGCGLDVTLPEGRIRCEQATDCPPAWTCQKAHLAAAGLCYSTGTDGGLAARDGSAENSKTDGAQPNLTIDAGPNGDLDAALNGNLEAGPNGDPDAAPIDGSDGSTESADGGSADAGPSEDASAMTDAAMSPDAAISADAGPTPSDAGTNKAPTIAAVSLGKRFATQGANVTAVCLASDPNQDTLSYAWRASVGSFADATVRSATYTASALGEATLTCSVTDGRGGQAEESNKVRVYPVGLVALLPFSLDATDQSGNGNHGTVQGAVFASDRAGHAASALRFGDANASVPLANEHAFDLPAFSFVATVKPESATHGGTIVTKAAVGFGSFTVYLYADNDGSLPGRLQWAQYSAGTGTSYALVLGNYRAVVGQFFQLAVTRSGTGDVRAYVDGALIHSSTGMPPALLNDAPVSIGSGLLGGFQGIIDEVQVYDHVLTAAQVQALTGLQ